MIAHKHRRMAQEDMWQLEDVWTLLEEDLPNLYLQKEESPLENVMRKEEEYIVQGDWTHSHLQWI